MLKKNLFLHFDHYDLPNGIIDVTKNWCTSKYRNKSQDLMMKSALNNIILKNSSLKSKGVILRQFWLEPHQKL